MLVHDRELDVSPALNWIEHTVTDHGRGDRRIELRADSIDWLTSTVAQLVTIAPLTVVSPPELVDHVGRLGRCFVDATAGSLAPSAVPQSAP